MLLGTKMIMKKIMPLCILLPKMSAYRKIFDKTKYMFFFIKDVELIEGCNEILDKVSKVIRKGFDNEPV